MPDIVEFKKVRDLESGDIIRTEDGDKIKVRSVIRMSGETSDIWAIDIGIGSILRKGTLEYVVMSG